nr:hypothetical protein L203_03174 [Cryptococcus depauperatus CBS 7841]
MESPARKDGIAPVDGWLADGAGARIDGNSGSVPSLGDRPLLRVFAVSLSSHLLSAPCRCQLDRTLVTYIYTADPVPIKENFWSDRRIHWAITAGSGWKDVAWTAAPEAAIGWRVGFLRGCFSD